MHDSVPITAYIVEDLIGKEYVEWHDNEKYKVLFED